MQCLCYHSPESLEDLREGSLRNFLVLVEFLVKVMAPQNVMTWPGSNFEGYGLNIIFFKKPKILGGAHWTII
jgi:hypothetical protein